MSKEDRIKITVDVRETPPREHRALVLRTFDQLSIGDALLLIDDHDPRSLFHQLQAEDNGEFTWGYLETGPGVWRVRIGKAQGTAPRLCGCGEGRREGPIFS